MHKKQLKRESFQLHKKLSSFSGENIYQQFINFKVQFIDFISQFLFIKFFIKNISRKQKNLN